MVYAHQSLDVKDAPNAAPVVVLRAEGFQFAIILPVQN